MKATTKQTVRQAVKLGLGAVALIALVLIGYRYYNQPVQSWNANDFEGRKPDVVQEKGQGQKYWTGGTIGNGFYVTNTSVSPNSPKTYCVNGGVTSPSAQFILGGVALEADNGYFTRCTSVSVNDQQQLNFSVKSGTVQIYSIDRKR